MSVEENAIDKANLRQWLAEKASQHYSDKDKAVWAAYVDLLERVMFGEFDKEATQSNEKVEADSQNYPR